MQSFEHHSTLDAPCPQCHEPLPAAAKFCASCGMRACQTTVAETQADSIASQTSDRSPNSETAGIDHPERPGLGAELQATTTECGSGQVLLDNRKPQAGPDGNESPCCPTCGAQVSPPELWLTRVRPNGDSQAFAFTGDELVVGKDANCDFAIDDDAYVSRRHTRLHRNGDQIVLEDLESANGTHVRVRRPLDLCPGDEFMVGTTTLRLETNP